MAKVMNLKLEKTSRKGLAVKGISITREELGNIGVSLGGIALGLTFIIMMLILTDGASVVLKELSVFAMTVASAVLSALAFFLSDKSPNEYKRKVGKTIAVIAGAPVWYILAGITYVLSIL